MMADGGAADAHPGLGTRGSTASEGSFAASQESRVTELVGFEVC